jgi:cyclopropane fatty-acyl-phospholipid synthase-like methyltransferase
MMSSVDPLGATLAPMLWRAQTFHVLPGQSILEIGCGDGAFTRQLAKATRASAP